MTLLKTEEGVKVEATDDPLPLTPPLPTYDGEGINGDHKSLFRDDSPPPPMMSPPPRSPSPSPPPSGRKNGSGSKVKKEEAVKPIIIDHLPTAWEEAHETFDALERCIYERKDLGLSNEQDEMMVCDCVYDKHDPHAEPCGPHSDCINRAIFIECLADECRAKTQCQNQRFTKRQYAPIDIVLTEMKGYGLRAADDIPSGSLIYEYIGEVVQEKTFRKRMQQYADEGIRHFYFMMLQKEEYIDATKKGGIGRFANHSCNPNSEVQKWVVGRRLRMGIFTKRDVLKGEEITFNYNVDRYGHEAQTCYCGEPNCVGTIGGKTQTDLGTINDLFLDGLGITDEVEELGLKGSKKKKSRQLDEDWTPTLRPIEREQEVQKVAAAIRQSTENVKMMSRLLQRVTMTLDPVMHRQFMRMHGFGLMNTILTQMGDEREIVLLALESMDKWKLQIRNKIEDSNIEEPVQKLQDAQDERISGLSKRLLEYWSTLELSARIPRKSKIQSLDEDDEADTTTIAEAATIPVLPRRPQNWENTTTIQLNIAPVRPRPPPIFDRRPPPPVPKPPPPPVHSTSDDQLKIEAIIARAQQSAAAVLAREPSASPVAESSRSGSRAYDEDRDFDREHGLDRRKKQKRDHTNGERDEAKKEKRLTKMVGDVVVRSMSKYKEQMDHETFKRYAKECTMILVEKEKKGHSYSTSRHPSLTEEKRAKMKAFTKEYSHKVLRKLKEKGKLRAPKDPSRSSRSVESATPSTIPPDTPITLSTPSATIKTPDGQHGELLTDIFGGSDDEAEDGDTPMDIEPDDSPMRTPIHVSPSSVVVKPIGLEKINGLNGAIRVDSFRPGLPTKSVSPVKVVGNGIQPMTMDTPSRTPTSGGGGPSPGDR